MRHPGASLLVVGAAGLLATLAAPSPARADTVRLENGRSYEGVIAETLPEGVLIRLAFGQLLIPHDQVAAVERAPSALADYLHRKAALAARPRATATDWLALARWAKANDLPQGVREAALRASELDPRLPALDPLLRAFGLVLDEALGRWIPFEESMARQGMVRFEGEWISREEQRERLAERERQRLLEAEATASRRLADAAEQIQSRQEETAREEWYAPAGVVFVPFTVPVFVVPSLHGGAFRPHRPWQPEAIEPPSGAPPAPRAGYSGWVSRPPGSLLPPEPTAPPDKRSTSADNGGGG